MNSSLVKVKAKPKPRKAADKNVKPGRKVRRRTKPANAFARRAQAERREFPTAPLLLAAALLALLVAFQAARERLAPPTSAGKVSVSATLHDANLGR